ncbi:two-component regulator propeller domain-containing protein [Dyadobacter crusticola]|uniref:two-component regulator propeller domain-containing protein n=1 Tax=Dyadobacter crusticola TaxID=292407 RepID=UPI0004E0CC9B|nr:two-component regulator propeller domain-containing protein [Dyadobacter crusticola]
MKAATLKVLCRIALLALVIVGCKAPKTANPDELSGEWKAWYSPYSPYFISTFAIDELDNKWVSCQGDSSALRMLNSSGWHYFKTEKPGELDSFLKRIYADQQRILWKGSGVVIDLNTVKKVNGTSKRWQVYNVADKRKSAALKMDDGGVLWEAMEGGVRCFDGRSWTNHIITGLKGSQAVRIVFDGENSLLVSNLPDMGQRGQVMKREGNTWTQVLECDPSHWVPTMLVDQQNVLWLGVLSRATVGNEFGQGLVRIQAGKWTSYTISNSSIPSNSVVEISEDRNGRLWLGTYSGGVGSFDKESTWSVINKSNSPLPFNSVEFIEFDKKGDMWLGVQFNGIAQISNVSRIR